MRASTRVTNCDQSGGLSLIRKLLAAVLLLIPGVAHAEWLRAESKNFVVIGDRPEAEIRDSISKMEKYAFVLRAVSGRKIDETPNKIKIYLVRDISAVGRTRLGGGYGVAGYYMPIAQPFLVTPRLGRAARDGRFADKSATATNKGDNHDIVFYHELTHHFMFQYFSAAYPTWYSEAFAEFYGTFTIEEQDDTDLVAIGTAHEWRVDQLRNGGWLPMRKLLTARSYADVGEDIGNLYAQGWLFQHYAANNKARNAQLKRYLDLINGGTSYEKAAVDAFGADLDKLDAELRAYARRPTIDKFILPFKKIDVGPIELRRLTPAEADLWMTELQSAGPVPKSEAGGLRTSIRNIAGKYPNDVYALKLLTLIEQRTGNRTEAEAALARWLAVAPQDPTAILTRGTLAIDALEAAKAPADDPRWAAARKDIIAANKLAPKDPMILKAFYDSYEAAGVLPPVSAQNALMEAMRVAPQDDNIRQQVAIDFEKREMLPEAMAVLRPLAFAAKPQSEMTDAEKKREARIKGYYIDWPDYENPRDMYDRLEKKLAETGKAPPAD